MKGKESQIRLLVFNRERISIEIHTAFRAINDRVGIDFLRAFITVCAAFSEMTFFRIERARMVFINAQVQFSPN